MRSVISVETQLSGWLLLKLTVMHVLLLTRVTNWLRTLLILLRGLLLRPLLLLHHLRTNLGLQLYVGELHHLRLDLKLKLRLRELLRLHLKHYLRLWLLLLGQLLLR